MVKSAVAEVKAAVASNGKRGRGRPAKFDAKQVRQFKAIVRKLGLVKGHKEINEVGITVKVQGEETKVPTSISLVTLGKYIHSEIAGNGVALQVGRPKIKTVKTPKVAAVAPAVEAPVAPAPKAKKPKTPKVAAVAPAVEAPAVTEPAAA